MNFCFGLWFLLLVSFFLLFTCRARDVVVRHIQKLTKFIEIFVFKTTHIITTKMMIIVMCIQNLLQGSIVLDETLRWSSGSGRGRGDIDGVGCVLHDEGFG